MNVAVTVLAGLLMLIGLIGILVPVLPDVLLIWAAALGYGLIVGWGESGPWLFGFITLLGLIGLAADIWVSGAGAKVAGASIQSLLIGLLFGAAGLFFSPIGGLVGLLLGVFAAEYIRFRNVGNALKAVAGLGVGYGASFGVKLILCLLMIGAWVAWLLNG
jgi:uncharacterized protein YqgC (DUF456 family)